MHAPPNPPLPPPPAHSPRQLTSPRVGHHGQHLPSPRSSPRVFQGGPPGPPGPPPGHMENGGPEYIPISSTGNAVSVSRSVAPGPPQPPGPPHHHLLTVVSSAGPQGRSGLPPPPPRQSSYSMPSTSAHHHLSRQPPPSHGGLHGPPRPHVSQAMLVRGPPPPMPPHSGAFPGGHYVMERGINQRGIHEKR